VIGQGQAQHSHDVYRIGGADRLVLRACISHAQLVFVRACLCARRLPDNAASSHLQYSVRQYVQPAALRAREQLPPGLPASVPRRSPSGLGASGSRLPAMAPLRAVLSAAALLAPGAGAVMSGGVGPQILHNKKGMPLKTTLTMQPLLTSIDPLAVCNDGSAGAQPPGRARPRR
jgi:hypothetical protein